MLIRLAHSPDPDDAFMFYGLSQGAVDAGPYRFEHILEDIQSLNDRAMRGEYEMTAISLHAYPYVKDRYQLTACGCSMGDNYGPMVVTRTPMTVEQLKGRTIAVPGLMTTAYLALQLLLGPGKGSAAAETAASAPEQPAAINASGFRQHVPQRSGAAFTPRIVYFDKIPAEVKNGRVDAGLIIHEGQLTYEKDGLRLVVDLGRWWMEKTGLPLPLGGNVVRRDLGPQVCRDITRIMKASIEYSLAHREEAVKYALRFGRGLDEGLADRFVGMYVNKWTLDYGPRGREAVQRLLAEGARAGLIPDVGTIEFVE
ncbi:MAG: ABC transporter substrate-binding protein [Planctomycetes bacterium]|nr:ABC transporter substrate-binding protein [Planctomycetota bacterium]